MNNPDPIAPTSASLPQSAGPASPVPSRRSALWLACGVALGAAAAGAWWASSRPQTTPGPSNPGSGSAGGPSGLQKVGPEFWQAGLTAPDGSALPVAQWQGKPLLLNFWATWCPPCLREMPLLDRFHQRLSAQGMVVVGLAVDSPAAVQAWLSKTPMSFPIAMAGAVGTEMSRQWGNRQGGLPFSVLVDAQSGIVERHVGELNEATLDLWARRTGLKI